MVGSRPYHLQDESIHSTSVHLLTYGFIPEYVISVPSPTVIIGVTSRTTDSMCKT